MIREQIEDNIVIATFENGKNNTITLETLQNLSEIVKKVNTDDSLKGIVLTGAGKTFCAGFDLPMFLSFKDLKEVVAFFEKEEEILIDLFMCKKPVVAAINGAAVAGGLIISMAADYRIVKNHPKIRLGMSEIKIGLGLSIVQTELMRYGYDSNKKFRDLIFNGEMFDVARAKELDVVDEIAEEAELMNRAKAVVKGWIDNPGRAFMLLKKSFRKPYEERMRSRLKNEEWKPDFNCFFDPATRKTLEAVKAMMG